MTGGTLVVEGSEPLPELTAAVQALCAEVEAGADRRTVVVRVGSPAAARHEPAGTLDVHDVTRWEKALRRLTRQAAVVIAAVHGTCAGPALDLLLSADHRPCHTDARLVLADRSGLLWPGMALHRLVHQLGAGRARQIVLRRDHIDAPEAAALGLVDDVTDAPDAAVAAAVRRFATLSGAEFAVRRQLLQEAVTTGFDEALGVHLAACDRELRLAREESSWTSC